MGGVRPPRQAGTPTAASTVSAVPPTMASTGMGATEVVPSTATVTAHPASVPTPTPSRPRAPCCDQEQQGDLAPGEAHRLERGQVAQLAEHPPAGRVGQRQGGGDQPDHAEQRQQRAEQPVVELHRGPYLAPGVDALHTGPPA